MPISLEQGKINSFPQICVHVKYVHERCMHIRTCVRLGYVYACIHNQNSHDHLRSSLCYTDWANATGWMQGKYTVAMEWSSLARGLMEEVRDWILRIQPIGESHTQSSLSLRSVIWMQKRREDVMERLRGTSQRREDQHEMQIGRLKQDRVQIPRDEDVCKCMCREKLQYSFYSYLTDSLLGPSCTKCSCWEEINFGGMCTLLPPDMGSTYM